LPFFSLWFPRLSALMLRDCLFTLLLHDCLFTLLLRRGFLVVVCSSLFVLCRRRRGLVAIAARNEEA
jgi:hypothetical protein